MSVKSVRRYVLFLTAKIETHYKSMEPIPMGGVAANHDGTIVAYVSRDRHYLTIGSVGRLTLFGGVPLRDPRFVCFVRRKHVDTLLICDYNNHRIVETSVDGRFVRAIAFPTNPYGVAYCDRSDAIAVSYAHTVVLLQYACGSPVVQLGCRHVCDSDTRGSEYGRLFCPRGVRFTTDGSRVLVADRGNHRVCKFDATDGTFICHVATKEAHGIELPTDVIESEDGDIVVACRGGVVVVKNDEATLMRPSDNGFRPLSLYSKEGNIWVNETNNMSGRVAIAVPAAVWYSSPRCAWVSACVTYPCN